MKVDYIMGGFFILVTIVAVAESEGLNHCNADAAVANLSLWNYELNCQGQNLTRFPVFAQARRMIKVLDLQYNRIKIIQSGSLEEYSSLITLNLSGNAIKRVGESAFGGANRLEKLDLSSNMISEFAATDLGESLAWLSIASNSLRNIPTNLKHFKTLRHLDLSKNHFITKITEGSLPPSLLELNLRFTSIKYFTQATFSGLSELKTLYLSDNMGSSSLKFSTKPFDELKSLESLDLSRSFCRKLRTDSFMALKNLKVLRMNSCWLAAPPQLYRIPTIQRTTGSPLSAENTTANRLAKEWYNPHLKVLDLSNNRRMTITPSFDLPPSLKMVYLTHSRVRSVDEPIFTKESSVHFLDLSYSGLTSLSEDAISNAKNLTRVTFSGNPISIIPRIPESLQILNMSKTSVTNITRVTMATAFKLEEMRLNQAEIEYIEDFTFRNMSSLQKLDLSQNKLQKISRNTLVIGSRHRRALVTHRGQSRLLELNISSNALIRVSRKAFACHSHLRILDLSHNAIQSLDIKQFDGLQNLVELRLQENKIVNLEARAFAGLHNLEILHLENNQLDFIYDGTFTNLPRLTHIYLQSNSIRQRTVHLRTPALQYIDISNNSIWKIPKLTSQVRILKASFNDITSIQNSALVKATSLEELELNSCYLESLNFTIFSNTPLKTLSLTDNFLPHFVNSEMPSLENLYMSSNQLREISEKLVETLPMLKTLDLRFNNITNVNPNIFDGLNKLKKLHLSENNFNCDCSMYDFVQWLDKADETGIITDARFYQCEKPEEEYAMPVLDVVEKLSTCTQPNTNSEAVSTSIPSSKAHNTIILSSCSAVLLILGFCIAYAVAKKWSFKIKLKVKDNNNKHLRGKAVKCDAGVHSQNSPSSKVT